MFAIPTAAAGPVGIAAGPDGNLWFTEQAANQVAWITPAGAVVELACVPTAGSGLGSITAGPDGNVWFTEGAAGKIGGVLLGRLRR
jgi:virginiamycin B lyase